MVMNQSNYAKERAEAQAARERMLNEEEQKRQAAQHAAALEEAERIAPEFY